MIVHQLCLKLQLAHKLNWGKHIGLEKTINIGHFDNHIHLMNDYALIIILLVICNRWLNFVAISKNEKPTVFVH